MIKETIKLRMAVRSLMTGSIINWVDEFKTEEEALEKSKMYERFIKKQKRKHTSQVDSVILSDEEDEYWKSNTASESANYCIWYLEDVVNTIEINTKNTKINMVETIKDFHVK